MMKALLFCPVHGNTELKQNIIMMEQFREMRRNRQQLSEEESISILRKSTAGTLALMRMHQMK